MILSRIRKQTTSPVAAVLVAALCASMVVFSSPAAFAAMPTPAGTAINHPVARIYTVSLPGGEAESNAPAPSTVQPIYGFMDNPFAPTAVPLKIEGGQPAEYTFSVVNNGNIAGEVRVNVSAMSNAAMYPGVTWSVEVDDASPFVSGLSWRNSGTSVASMVGDTATSGISVAPGSGATFTMRVNGAGATHGATAAFSITLETIGPAPGLPGGAYDSEYNSLSYAGPASVSSGDMVNTLPPSLTITSPMEGQETSAGLLAFQGVTAPGVTATVNVIGPLSGQQYVESVPVGPSGSFNKNVLLFAGANQVQITAMDWMNNTAAQTLTVHNDEQAPVVTISMSDNVVGPNVAVQGRAYDTLNHMQIYTLEYGAGENPTVWRTITTGTSAIGSASANGTLATWDTTGLSGVYTLRLTAADRAPFNTTSEARRTINLTNLTALTGTIPAGTWTMVALPGTPTESDPRTFLGGGRYEVQRWDPTLPTDPDLLKYKINNISISNAGMGFWVKPYDAPISYSVNAYTTNTSATVEMQIRQGWNQIGSPFKQRGTSLDNYEWGRVQVMINKGASGQETKTMADAITAGWIDSRIYEYSQSGYVGRGPEDGLVPNMGYFIQTFRDCHLLFDPGAGLPMGLARIVRPAYEWKMRLAAEAEGLTDADNVAAVLLGAADGFDPADSGEPPVVKPYVALSFRGESDPADGQAARLAMDVRPNLVVNQTKTWNFVVEISDPGRNVALTVPEVENLPDNYMFTIKDELTGAEFDPKLQNTYSYFETGSVRQFTLTARKMADLAAARLTKRFPRGWTMFSVPLEPDPTDVRFQLADHIRDVQVFQYFDREFYDPDHEQKVDIQAGIGYWAYLEDERDIEFTGKKLEEGAAVEIPLTQGWNLIGNPYESVDVDGERMRFERGGESASAEEAVERGWIAPFIFEFNNVTGGYERHQIGVPLSPWKGYAIKAAEACSLIIQP